MIDSPPPFREATPTAQTRRKRACIFCGGPANSKEHAWPEWILSKVRGGGGTPAIRGERDGEPPREWHGLDASVQVRCVCVSCNTGWMSRLEDEACPVLLPLIIEGRAADLTTQQQLTVATWSVKTAMVFDRTRASHNWYFSQGERDYLFKARRPGGVGSPFPPSTFVWLAAYDGADPVTTAASELIGIGAYGPDRKQDVIRGHVATISAGTFVTQVLTVRLPHEKYIDEPPDDASGGRWDRTTVRIWPLRSGGGQVGWPPQLRLDDGGMSLDEFAIRFPVRSTKARPGRA